MMKQKCCADDQLSNISMSQQNNSGYLGNKLKRGLVLALEVF